MINKESARVRELYQDEMEELTHVRDRVLRKPDYAAGLAEDRVRNKADELSKKHTARSWGSSTSCSVPADTTC